MAEVRACANCRTSIPDGVRLFVHGDRGLCLACHQVEIGALGAGDESRRGGDYGPVVSLRPKGVVVLACFAALAVVALLQIWNSWQLADYLAVVRLGHVDRQRGAALDHRSAQLAAAYWWAFVPTAVAFLVWMHRATKNLFASGLRGLEHSPGETVGAFLIPLVNLVMPVRAMAQLWRGSACLASRAPTLAWRQTRLTPMIAVWWILFLSRGVVAWASAFALNRAIRGRDLAGMIRGERFMIGSELVNLVALLAALLLVRAVTRMQVQMQRLPEDVAQVFA
jgi:hypothetical protein